MLCQNCGKREANIHYTQIINGVKKEMILCEECARELGVERMHFDMPIHFSNFFEDMFEPYSENSFIGSLQKTNTMLCEKCHTTFDEFMQKGLLGCENCYDTFADRMDAIFKSLQGSDHHIGRREKNEKNIAKGTTSIEDKKESQNNEKLEQLKIDLKKKIQEENYEEAAKIRDEIKKIEKEGGKS